MSEYRIEPVVEFETLNNAANYLVLFGVDNTPPHIGFVNKGKYYSNNSRGGKSGYDFFKILNSINRKRIPTLLISLDLDQLMPEHFFKRTPLNLGESCLTPIKLMLEKVEIPVQDSIYVFDLLELLETRKIIEKVEHLYCTDLISNNIITLKKYTQVEIDNAISEAKRLC